MKEPSLGLRQPLRFSEGWWVVSCQLILPGTIPWSFPCRAPGRTGILRRLYLSLHPDARLSPYSRHHPHLHHLSPDTIFPSLSWCPGEHPPPSSATVPNLLGLKESSWNRSGSQGCPKTPLFLP